MLILALALAADAHAAELERLTLGLSSGFRVGDPYTLQEPQELAVTTFIAPWLGVQGRVGVSLHHGYYLLPDGFTAILSGDVRFGADRGFYASVGAQVHFPPELAIDPSPRVVYGVRAGWRFHAGDVLRISPELQLGVLYGGLGVLFELPVVRDGG